MGILDTFKRNKNANVPPDIGQEGEAVIEVPKVIVKEKVVSKGGVVPVPRPGNTQKVQDPKLRSSGVNTSKVTRKVSTSAVADERKSFELEKINARLEEIGTRMNQFNERFSQINESIGEMRAMNLSNEKKILSSMKDATRVIEMFNEVKPQNLRIDYQRMDIRLKKLEEKISGYRQLVDSVITEFGDLRKKSEAFMGTEGLIKMNSDMKKDLIETQKMSEKTKMYSDQTKQIFLELKSSFAESQRIDSVVSNLNESFSVVKEDLEKLKIAHNNVVKHEDYTDFKKTYNTKLAGLNQALADIENLKKNNEGLTSFIEESLSISKQNSEDINNLALGGAEGDTKRIENYENHLAEIVEIVGVLANQISELRKGKGIGGGSLKTVNPPVVGSDVASKSINHGTSAFERAKQRSVAVKGEIVSPKNVQISKPVAKKIIPTRNLQVSKPIVKNITTPVKPVVSASSKPSVKPIVKLEKERPLFQDKKEVSESMIGKLYNKIKRGQKDIVNVKEPISKAKSVVNKSIPNMSIIKKRPPKKKMSKKRAAELMELRLKNLEKARRIRIKKRKDMLRNLKKARKVLKEKRKKLISNKKR